MATGFVLTHHRARRHRRQPARPVPYACLAIATGICGIGMGISTPSSNNATLQLAPDDSATLAGMFRQYGSITAVSITAAIVAGSADPGIARRYVFLAFAAFMVCSVPLILLAPDHHGQW